VSDGLQLPDAKGEDAVEFGAGGEAHVVGAAPFQVVDLAAENSTAAVEFYETVFNEGGIITADPAVSVIQRGREAEPAESLAGVFQGSRGGNAVAAFLEEAGIGLEGG